MAEEEQDALDAMSSEFIAEIKDDLASLETDLLAMEEKGADTDDDLINHAFRSIHSIKGGAGFLNFRELSGLGHVMESVLMQIREKKLAISCEIVDSLLSGFDKMKLMVEGMGKDVPCDYSEEQAALKRILESPPGISPQQTEKTASEPTPEPEPVPAVPATEPDVEDPIPEEDPAPAPREDQPSDKRLLKPVSDSPHFLNKAFSVDAGRLDNALECQKYIYAVCLLIKKDLADKEKKIDTVREEIKSIGDILYPEQDLETDKDTVYFVIATILDVPLLVQVLEIDDSQLSLMDKQFTSVQTILSSLDVKKDSEKKKCGTPGADEEDVSAADGEAAAPSTVNEPRLSASSSQTLRINVNLISRLMNRAGELVLSRNQLRPLLEFCAAENKNTAHMVQNLDMVTTDIQEAIMQMRMQPVIDLLGKYKRVVRDIARRISKKVELVLAGGDVEVDRNVLEKLANPVTHLIRNCIDHGIESPEQRRKNGKPETGTITIKAYHQGGHVHLCISDDGAGIDPQLVLSKAFEKGLVEEEQLDQLTDKQKVNLIFLPGFSTSEAITDISGRGVGMDVVKTNIEQLRGQIEIESVRGEGTRVDMIIPLTLAIVPSLIVSTGSEKFAIPQVNIKEVIYLDPGQIHSRVESIGGSEVLRLRELLLPILRLRTVLGIKTYIDVPHTGQKIEEKRAAIADRRQKQPKTDIADKRATGQDRRKTQWDATYVIVLKIGRDIFGLCVDELHDIEEVVVEPLSDYIKNLTCYSGATILGDGNVIMILDIAGIASGSSLRFENIRTETDKRKALTGDSRRQSGAKQNLIVFCNDDKEFFALPLEHASRLEPVNPKDIHHTGELKYIEHNGVPVLLVSMDDLFTAGKCSLDVPQLFTIFPKFDGAKVGILASGIIDTIEINTPLEKDETCADEVLGKLFIDKMMIQVLDHKKLAAVIEQKVAQAKEKA